MRLALFVMKIIKQKRCVRLHEERKREREKGGRFGESY